MYEIFGLRCISFSFLCWYPKLYVMSWIFNSVKKGKLSLPSSLPSLSLYISLYLSLSLSFPLFSSLHNPLSLHTHTIICRGTICEAITWFYTNRCRMKVVRTWKRLQRCFCNLLAHLCSAFNFITRIKWNEQTRHWGALQSVHSKLYWGFPWIMDFSVWPFFEYECVGYILN